MIEVKLGALQSVISSLDKIIKAKGINVKAAYWALKIQKKLYAENQNFSEVRVNLCKKYAELDKDKQPIIENDNFVIKEDSRKEFNEEFKTLSEEVVKIDNLYPINVDRINIDLVDIIPAEAGDSPEVLAKKQAQNAKNFTYMDMLILEPVLED